MPQSSLKYNGITYTVAQRKAALELAAQTMPAVHTMLQKCVTSGIMWQRTADRILLDSFRKMQLTLIYRRLSTYSDLLKFDIPLEG